MFLVVDQHLLLTNMDKPLNDFVDSCNRIADQRNLGLWSPVTITIGKPTVAGFLIVVCSVEEPSAIHYELGTLWIPADSSSVDYRQCLKLTSPDSAGLYVHTWSPLFNYSELDLVQRVADHRGPRGAVGPEGSPGETGEQGIPGDSILAAGIPSVVGETTLDGDRVTVLTGAAVEQLAYLSDLENSSKTYKFEPLVPLSDYIITHGLNSDLVLVQCWTLDKREVKPANVEILNSNQVYVSFSAPIGIKILVNS
jgi:hypothetical protein